MKNPTLLKTLLLALLLAGAAYAGHLTTLVATGDLGCSVGAVLDCAANLHSAYAHPFGVPITTVAMAAFAFAFVHALGAALGVGRAGAARARPGAATARDAADPERAFFALPLLFGYACGAVALGYLAIAVGVLHALCARCAVLDGIIAAVIAVAAFGLGAPLRRQPAAIVAALRASGFAGAIPAAIVVAACLALANGDARSGGDLRPALDQPLHVVEYGDFECPACREAGQRLEALAARFPARLRVSFVNFPLCAECNPDATGTAHPHACVAAKIGLVLTARGKFAAFSHALFADRAPLDDARLDRIVASLGEDAADVRAAAALPETADALRRDIAAAEAAHVRMTPTFRVDDERTLEGVAAIADIGRALDAAADAPGVGDAGATFAAAPVLTTGRTLFVAPGGSDDGACSQAAPCATPDHAFDHVAGPGDTVVVAPGTYDYGAGALELTTSGAAGATKTLTCATPGACRIVNAVVGNMTVVWIMGGHVRFDGFEVTNDGPGNNMGVYVTASYVTLTRNVIHHIETDCGDNGGGGITIAGSGSADSGIHDIVIDSNRIYDISWTSCQGSPSVQTDGILVESAGSGQRVVNNLVFHCAGGWGILVGNSNDTHASVDTVIANNTVFANGNGGIIVVSGDGTTIADNIVLANGLINAQCGINAPPGVAVTYAANDLFGNAGGNYCIEWGAGTSAVHADDIAVDPAAGTTFVDWRADGSGDYHLRAGSPAIAAGVAGGAPTTDFDGRSRSGAIDIGAFQHDGDVATAPTITSEPIDRSVGVGQTATFSVGASGSPAPTFQWQRDGADIAGATASAYTTPATVAGDSGSVFRVVVANSAGSVTSADATLTVTVTGGGGTVTGTSTGGSVGTTGGSGSGSTGGSGRSGHGCGAGAALSAIAVAMALGTRLRRR